MLLEVENYMQEFVRYLEDRKYISEKIQQALAQLGS